MTILIDRIRRRRAARLVCVLVVAGMINSAMGCSNPASEQAAADSPLSISVKQQFMTIQNKAGLPLTDVTIAIVPVGRQTEYTKFYGRIESSQNFDLSLGDFHGRDGTPCRQCIVYVVQFAGEGRTRSWHGRQDFAQMRTAQRFDET